MQSAELAEKRTQRRKVIEQDGELTALERTLVLGIHEHGDDMVDTMREGFGGIQTLLRWGLGLVVGGGLGVILFLIAGLMLLRGVDPNAAASAAKTAAEAVQPAAPPGGEED